ncbi:MAG: glutamate synthase [Thermodesulfobacteriota bacterium]
MCRLFALTSEQPESPMRAIRAMDAMREGHDGSGVGIYMTELGGSFEELKEFPILSGIFTRKGLEKLDEYMNEHGFEVKYSHYLDVSDNPPPGVPKRDHYIVRAYDYPREWQGLSQKDIEHKLMLTRLELRKLGSEKEEMIVYSFWPDVIMIKEIGDPMSVARSLGLENSDLRSRVIMSQGRQNTNYAINLYACHPFFLQGYATMTNGENTAFVPIKEFLQSRGFPGYSGYQSDSEVFTHILHYIKNSLNLDVSAYKHVITPLQGQDILKHPDSKFLQDLKHVCRRLIIDGPNCIIGCLPDKTMFMAQDRKKLRPGVVGGKPGIYAFSSEICGIDAALPDLGRENYFQPMHQDTALVTHDRQEVKVCSQMDTLNQVH